MLTPDLKNKISELWNIFWSNGIADPLFAISQISYLIFMKRLEDFENETIISAKSNNRNYKSIFDGNEKMRWSIWQNYEGKRMVKHVERKVFPFIKKLKGQGNYFTRLMSDAHFGIKNASLLQEAVQKINDMDIASKNIDVQGDIYEDLLSALNTSGRNGQFRTPRHIIRLMVDLVDPKIYQKICDPACGTAGFLVGAYQHILEKNTSDELIIYDNEGIPHNFIGDKLTLKDWHFLTHYQFYGYDFDTTMVRIGAMNMILHGINEPNLENTDTLSKRYHQTESYDCILANPPFSGSLNRNEINDNFRIKTRKTELLFMELFYNLLVNGGQAAVIVIEGALTGSSDAHKSIRKKILQNCRIDCIISMPSGVFKPYAGVATSILIFTKGESTKKVWFYKMENDGYSLDDRRTKIDETDIPDIIQRFKKKENSSKSWTVDIDEIQKNDWNLSASRYRPYIFEEKQYDDPIKVIDTVSKLEEEIRNDLKLLKERIEFGLT